MVHAAWAGSSAVFQLSILATSGGQQIVNVFHFGLSGPENAVVSNDAARLAKSQEIIDTFQAGELPEWLALHHTSYTVNMLRVQCLEVPGQVDHRLTPVEEALTTANTGTVASDSPDDLDSAIVLRWRTALAGKRFRGRSYIGPVPGLWSNFGQVASAGVTATTAFAEAMKSAYFQLSDPGPEHFLCIYSRPYNTGTYGYVRGSGTSKEFYYPPDYNGAMTPVLAYAVDPIMRVQRRREIGVGS